MQRSRQINEGEDQRDTVLFFALTHSFRLPPGANLEGRNNVVPRGSASTRLRVRVKSLGGRIESESRVRKTLGLLAKFAQKVSAGRNKHSPRRKPWGASAKTTEAPGRGDTWARTYPIPQALTKDQHAPFNARVPVTPSSSTPRTLLGVDALRPTRPRECARAPATPTQTDRRAISPSTASVPPTSTSKRCGAPAASAAPETTINDRP